MNKNQLHTFIMFKKLNIIAFIMFIGVLLSISASPVTYKAEINNVVQFEKENEYIGDTQKANLYEIYNLIKGYEDMPVVIIGHTYNDYGIARIDSLLALKRAGVVRDYLVDKGIKNPIILHVDMDYKYECFPEYNRVVSFEWFTRFNK